MKRRHKYKSFLLISALLLTIPVVATAQLTFVNNCCKDVYICIGYKENSTWIAKGWWKITGDGGKLTLVSGALTNRYYYYYAESTDKDKTYKWFGDATTFCILNEKFEIADTSPCKNGAYKQKFKKIDVEQNTDHTQIISCDCGTKKKPIFLKWEDEPSNDK